VEERDRPEQPPSRGDIVSPRVTSLDESMLLFPDTYRVLLELEDRLESISTMEELNYLEQGVEEIAPAIQAKKSVLQRKKEDEEAKCTVCLDSPPTMICIPCGTSSGHHPLKMFALRFRSLTLLLPVMCRSFLSM
jgi:hypothetical protein